MLIIERIHLKKFQKHIKEWLAIVANPIPEEYSMDKELIDSSIAQAIAEANEKGIHGKEITPFLLDKVQQITGGESLQSNIKLVFNNAMLGAEIAKEYCKFLAKK